MLIIHRASTLKYYTYEYRSQSGTRKDVIRLLNVFEKCLITPPLGWRSRKLKCVSDFEKVSIKFGWEEKIYKTSPVYVCQI